MENIDALCQKRMSWRASLSEEQLAALSAEQASWGVEETKQARMTEFTETFAAADTDSNGLLSRAEFEDFLSKCCQNSGARNVPFEPLTNYSAAEMDGMYAIFNENTADVDGVSQADFFATMMKVQKRMGELAS